MDANDYLPLIHDERRRLAEALHGLKEEQWAAATLCSRWTVRDVVAHLTAGASTGKLAWLRSMAQARFDGNRHNQRLVEKHRGDSYEQTLAGFNEVLMSTVVPSRDYAAYLGEVIVHGQDICRPLGITLVPDPISLTAVARFYKARDFAVNSRTLSRGLRMVADDGTFGIGRGDVVTGSPLALVMVLAGRPAFGGEISGLGAKRLRARLKAHAR